MRLHVFRHARATLFAQHLTDAQLKQHFGWRADSRMASVYVHLSGRDLDPTLAKLAGIKHEEPSNGMRKVRICEKCRTANSPESSRCVQCLRPFVTTEEEERKRIPQTEFNILRQFGVEVNEKQLTMLWHTLLSRCAIWDTRPQRWLNNSCDLTSSPAHDILAGPLSPKGSTSPSECLQVSSIRAKAETGTRRQAFALVRFESAGTRIL